MTMNECLPLSEQAKESAKAVKLAKLFVILALLFGVLMIFIEPPFVIPDENKHYINICRISHGGIFPQVKDDAVGSYITAEELDFLAIYEGVFINNENTYDLHSAVAHSQRIPTEELVFYKTGDATLNPTPYLIPAFAIAVLRFLFGSLNAFNSYFVAKLANLVFFVIVVRWALLKTKAMRKTMFLLALMPMTMFQAASASYDGCLISASFLLFAYLTKVLLSDDEYHISREDILAICFSAVFLIGVKVAYAPIILVLFAIPIKKFGTLKRYLICVGTVAGLGILFFGVPMLANRVITASCETVTSEVQLLQQQFIRENPMILPKMFFNTISYFSGYYLEGFFGILGWLDTNFPAMIVKLFLTLLFITAIAEVSVLKGIRWNVRLLSWAGITVFVVGTVYTMYSVWNPILTGIVGGDVAYGGQGRYFIPIALFLILILANPWLNKLRVRQKIHDCLEGAVSLTALTTLCLTLFVLFVRYWI